MSTAALQTAMCTYMTFSRETQLLPCERIQLKLHLVPSTSLDKLEEVAHRLATYRGTHTCQSLLLLPSQAISIYGVCRTSKKLSRPKLMTSMLKFNKKLIMVKKPRLETSTQTSLLQSTLMGVRSAFPLVYQYASCRHVTRTSALNKKRSRHTRMRLSDSHNKQRKKLHISGPSLHNHKENKMTQTYPIAA